MTIINNRAVLLKELPLKVINESKSNAKLYTKLFIEIAKKNTNKDIKSNHIAIIYKHFSYLMWFYANGIWSNIEDVELRRNLHNESSKLTINEISRVLLKTMPKSSNEQIKSDVGIEFQEYKRRFIKDLETKIIEGYEPDANSALFIILEWLKEEMQLSGLDMLEIVPLFIQDSRIVTTMGDIEAIAYEAIIYERNNCC